MLWSALTLSRSVAFRRQKYDTFESCRARQIFLFLQRDARARSEMVGPSKLCADKQSNPNEDCSDDVGCLEHFTV